LVVVSTAAGVVLGLELDRVLLRLAAMSFSLCIADGRYRLGPGAQGLR
jgi:hypothetical protein